MSKPDNEMEDLLNMWKQGQEAFFQAHKTAMDSFQASLSDPKVDFASSQTKAFDIWQDHMTNWTSAWGGEHKPDDAFANARKQFATMFDPSNWAQFSPEHIGSVLQDIAEGPQFADLATPHVEVAEAWRETLDYQQAATKMAKVLQATWSRAYERYSEKFSLEDLQSGDVQEALDEWLRAANAELLNTQRTADFMDAQRGMVRATLEIKARQRDVVEDWSKNYQIPTRSEIDDLTKIVHELRRELRQVKRQLAAHKASE